MAKRGRRLKLTPEVQALICEKLSAGVFFNHACLLAGIDESTAYRWKQRGELQKRGKFRDFCDALALADAQFCAGVIARARIAGKDDWRAQLAVGAIRFPKLFNPQVRVVVTHEIDAILDRVRVRFADQPVVYEAVLEAVAAGDVTLDEPQPDAPALPAGETPGAPE